jgi:hypothetical protein
MKPVLGIAMMVLGSVAGSAFGFAALMLGGGSLSQRAEARPYEAAATAAWILAVWGGRLVWRHVVERRRTRLDPP